MCELEIRGQLEGSDNEFTMKDLANDENMTATFKNSDEDKMKWLFLEITSKMLWCLSWDLP